MSHHQEYNPTIYIESWQGRQTVTLSTVFGQQFGNFIVGLKGGDKKAEKKKKERRKDILENKLLIEFS